jgi:hypothetical protein
MDTALGATPICRQERSLASGLRGSFSRYGGRVSMKRLSASIASLAAAVTGVLVLVPVPEG